VSYREWLANSSPKAAHEIVFFFGNGFLEWPCQGGLQFGLDCRRGEPEWPFTDSPLDPARWGFLSTFGSGAVLKRYSGGPPWLLFKTRRPRCNSPITPKEGGAAAPPESMNNAEQGGPSRERYRRLQKFRPTLTRCKAARQLTNIPGVGHAEIGLTRKRKCGIERKLIHHLNRVYLECPAAAGRRLLKRNRGAPEADPTDQVTAPKSGAGLGQLFLKPVLLFF